LLKRREWGEKMGIYAITGGSKGMGEKTVVILRRSRFELRKDMLIITKESEYKQICRLKK
jgi:hypothetical protein